MKKHVRKVWAWTALLLALCACTPNNPFVTVKDGHFVRDGKPYTFVGTNFWYGPILASEGRGGDLPRLSRELDALKELGVDNLRVLVGADGSGPAPSRIEPTLQVAPGVYNDTLLVGLDRFLLELGQRGMQAVLYVNNSWEWSGGYGQYLEWVTGEKPVVPLDGDYWPYTRQMRKFQTCTEAQQLYFNHLRNIVSRVNSFTGVPYKEDPVIFAWQLGNEPRCFSEDAKDREGFLAWMTEAARIVKELDGNHLLSTGSEGLKGCEEDPELLRAVSRIPGIDYMTLHIWPYNWGWVRPDHLTEDVQAAIEKTGAYLDLHRPLAQELGMPMVVEEFGFPRDGVLFALTAPTTARDKYYAYVFSQVGSRLDGANFWGWSGYAVPWHVQWQSGDPYTGDPAQEPQGLNGVYIGDTTLGVIAEANHRPTPAVEIPRRILYGHQDDLSYGHSWVVTDVQNDPLTRSDIKDVCGQYPAVLGFDLGGIELGDPCNLDGVPFELIRRAALTHIGRGGVVTFSWHPRNPLTGGDTWDVSSGGVVSSILPGGEKEAEFKLWLERLGTFLVSLDGAPFHFRPWHENTESWFWWGANLCSVQEYKALFRLTWNYLRVERGLEQISWCYSPNGPFSAEQYMERYPGDDCIDLLGADLYQFVGADGLAQSSLRFTAQVKEMLGTLALLAKEHGKRYCLSETGFEGIPDPHWWTQVLYPAIQGSGIEYVLTWRNAHNIPGHFYAPWKGFDHEEDFRQFALLEDILLL